MEANRLWAMMEAVQLGFQKPSHCSDPSDTPRSRSESSEGGSLQSISAEGGYPEARDTLSLGSPKPNKESKNPGKWTTREGLGGKSKTQGLPHNLNEDFTV